MQKPGSRAPQAGLCLYIVQWINVLSALVGTLGRCKMLLVSKKSSRPNVVQMFQVFLSLAGLEGTKPGYIKEEADPSRDGAGRPVAQPSPWSLTGKSTGKGVLQRILPFGSRQETLLGGTGVLR